MQQQAIGERKILPNAEFNMSMNGTLVESRFQSEVRFVTVNQTSLRVDGEDFRYLRIKGNSNNPITVAKPDANFKHIIILPSSDTLTNVVVMVWHTVP